MASQTDDCTVGAQGVLGDAIVASGCSREVSDTVDSWRPKLATEEAMRTRRAPGLKIDVAGLKSSKFPGCRALTVASVYLL
eukprot:4720413-Prymnesium_polylepis.1